MRLSLVALFGLLSTGLAQAAPAAERAALLSAMESISAEQLKGHVDVLADDTFEGREAGSRGGRAAGTYIMKLMRKYGLKGGGVDGGYTQDFDNGYRNLLGVIEGSDPQLKQEYVLVGAHYDHVGYGNQTNSYGPTGYIHNGADDNASGVSGLLEMMEAFSQMPSPPARSLVFAFWDGEEKGLLGSKHWVANPTLPLKQITVAFNSDMIGHLRNNKVEVYGTRSASGFRSLAARHNLETDLELDFTWELKDNSDHWSFYNREIPVLMFHTGLHDNYHRPSDDAHLINAEGMKKVSRLQFLVVNELANQSLRPGFRSRSRSEQPYHQQQLEQPIPAGPPRLGVAWDSENQTEGLRVIRVVPGSPAAVAGLQAGDRLVEFQGETIADDKEFRRTILRAPQRVLFKVRRPGKEDLEDLEMELGGSPVRVGLAWREDSAEPAAMLVTQVVPSSPAAEAKLQPRDRILEINGEKYEGSNDLLSRIQGAGQRIELLIERKGRIQSVELNCPPLEDQD